MSSTPSKSFPNKPQPVLLAGVFALVAGLMASSSADESPDAKTKLAFSVTVDFGADNGKSLGSLFEAKDAQGRVVAGAGFPTVYNTRYLMDRHTVQFFVRPPEGENQFTLERLPRPDDHCGLYMFDFAGRLFAINLHYSQQFSEWNPASGEWQAPAKPVEGLGSGYDGVVRVGDGVLRFADGRVFYNDKLILDAPAIGKYNYFYYGQGRLFFYHNHSSEQDGFTRIHACLWTPDNPRLIDPEKESDAVSVTPVGAATWAFGSLGQQVLTVTNRGGVYVHDGESWRTLREHVPNTSYQIYSVLNYRNKLLLGQYPTGDVFEYDGQELKHLPGFPPKLPEVSGSSRECQTLALYRGELYAGVWPWGEVWRHEEETDRWISMGRLFTHPEPHKRTTHPYEDGAKRHGLVMNDWGQRVTSAVPVGDSLMFATSAKNVVQWDAKYLDFMSEDARKEYGSVLKLKLPGNLSAPIQWKSGPTVLTFVVEADRLAISQDGRDLGSTPLDPEFVKTLKPDSISWGEGIFGRLDGEITQKEAGGPEWPAKTGEQ